MYNNISKNKVEEIVTLPDLKIYYTEVSKYNIYKCTRNSYIQ